MTDWITPYLPLIGVIVGGLIVGGFAIYNRKKGNLEVKVPSVAEAWNEARAVRAEYDDLDRKYRNLLDAYDALKRLFRGFVDRVQRRIHIELTHAEQTALALPEVDDDDYPTITPAQLSEMRPDAPKEAP